MVARIVNYSAVWCFSEVEYGQLVERLLRHPKNMGIPRNNREAMIENYYAVWLYYEAGTISTHNEIASTN